MFLTKLLQKNELLSWLLSNRINYAIYAYSLNPSDASNSNNYVSYSRAVRSEFLLKDKNCFILQALKQET